MLVSHPSRAMSDLDHGAGPSSSNTTTNAQAGPSRPTSALGLGISRAKEGEQSAQMDQEPCVELATAWVEDMGGDELLCLAWEGME